MFSNAAARASGACYTRSLARGTRKAEGIYYTPEWLTEYLVQRTVGARLARCRSPEDALRLAICDPACGAGYFLIAAQRLILRWVLQRGGTGARTLAELSREIQRRCLFGVDLDARAVRLARRSLPHARIARADSLADGTFGERGFEVVLGNPPYGGGLRPARFIELAWRLTSNGGFHGFVAPKPLLYSSAWKRVRDLLYPALVEIVDCGMAWDDVKLEQVAYVCEKKRAAARYRWSARRERTETRTVILEKKRLAPFGIIVGGVSRAELEIASRVRAAGPGLDHFASNRRGLMLQQHLVAGPGKGLVPVFGGKQITRYGELREPKGFVSAELVGASGSCAPPRAIMPPGSVIVQNLVAHVANPFPRLKIAGTLAPSARVVLDTVNVITPTGTVSGEVLLAILSSRLIAWYVYRFVVGMAVRTIHFDAPLTSRIPIPDPAGGRGAGAAHDELTRLVRQRLACRDAAVMSALENAIEERVLGIYGLEKDKAGAVGDIGEWGVRGPAPASI